MIEQFHTPDTRRSALTLDSVRRRAADHLAGRSVWCVAAASTEARATEALAHCLDGVRDQGVNPQRTQLRLREPLRGLMGHLDAMLRGVTLVRPTLGAGEDEAFRNGRRDGDTLVPGGVRAGDVVILHDPIAAALAPAIRERGAHTVWRTSVGRWQGNAAAAWHFLHRSNPALDAYVMTSRPRSHASSARARIAAYIAAPGVLSAKEVDAGGAVGLDSGYDEIGWTTLLADVVSGDRAERVGGTERARPSIAAR
jgi:hypothetical protein